MIVLNLTLAGQIFSYFKENGISYIDFPRIYEITKNNKNLPPKEMIEDLKKIVI